MNKPLTISYEEFKQSLANLINNCSLPSVLVESILQNYLNEISVIVKRQYQLDKIEYENTLNISVENDSDETSQVS